MRYQKITKFDVSNGPGIRTVVWVSGCSHRCPECHNPETWDPCSGTIFNDDTIDEILESLDSEYISGLTISGGDPLYFLNMKDVFNLISKVRSKYPNKSIWLYTGYTWEQILDEIEVSDYSYLSLIINNIDVLVDGEFDINQKDISLPYCGSRNQRVIDTKESLRTNNIVLYNND